MLLIYLDIVTEMPRLLMYLVVADMDTTYKIETDY
nr:MAG TPA: hypothetical protein [Caudoviricetes sp.]